MTLFRTAALVVVSSLFACPASAQPKRGEPQPDRLHIGTVYVGAIAEASFLVFEEGDNPGIKFDVTVPKFVKLLNKSSEVREYGREQKNFVYGSVELAIDTSVPGQFSGEVTVTLGQVGAKVPVSATVQARRPGLGRILIAETPFAKWSTGDGKMFEAWTELVEDSPLDVNYLLVNRGKPVLRDLNLEDFDCVFLPPGALVFATAEDIKRTREYAEKGGRVMVAANAFFIDSVKQANSVLAGYGLEMRNEDGHAVILDKEHFDARLTQAGLKSLHFFRASPTAVTDERKTRVLVKAVGAGQPGDGFVVSAKAGKGEVIALGQSLWWHWISKERAQDADNAKLLRWLLAPPRDRD
jgi:hypothetical protein